MSDREAAIVRYARAAKREHDRRMRLPRERWDSDPPLYFRTKEAERLRLQLPAHLRDQLKPHGRD